MAPTDGPVALRAASSAFRQRHLGFVDEIAVDGFASPAGADVGMNAVSRLTSEGVEITMPMTIEEWGERAFQVRDPNGVVVQPVDWNGVPTGDAPR